MGSVRVQHTATPTAHCPSPTHLKHADVVLPVDLITRRVPQLALAEVPQQLGAALEEVQAVLTKVQLLRGGSKGSHTTQRQTGAGRVALGCQLL